MENDQAQDVVRVLERVAEVEPVSAAIERALARTRHALTAASPSSRARKPRFSWIKSRPSLRFAVAAIVVLIALAGIGSVILTDRASSVAFADVQRAIERLAFVTCTVEAAEGNKYGAAGTFMFDFSRNRARFERADGGVVLVLDMSRGATMGLYPGEQIAVIHEDASTKGVAGTADFFEKVRNAGGEGVERLPDAEVHGRTVNCFRIREGAGAGLALEYLVSADPHTRLPVRTECRVRDDNGQLLVHSVLTDFVYDPLDPALFELIPPKGYHVQKVDNSTSREEQTIPLDGDFQTVDVEFRLAEAKPRDGLAAATVRDTGEEVYLYPEPLITRTDIDDARVLAVKFGVRVQPAIDLKFTAEGSQRMKRATSQNLGKLLAIIVDDQVVAAPVICSTISVESRLFGSFTLEEAKAIAHGLTADKASE